MNELGKSPQGYATYQISRLGLIVSDKKLFHVFSDISVCFWPQAHNLNILSGGLRIHNIYQGSRPCGFNNEDFFTFSYLAYVKHVTPRVRPIFGPRGIRTSDSLNERLPIKMAREVSKKMIFFP